MTDNATGTRKDDRAPKPTPRLSERYTFIVRVHADPTNSEADDSGWRGEVEKVALGTRRKPVRFASVAALLKGLGNMIGKAL